MLIANMVHSKYEYRTQSLLCSAPLACPAAVVTHVIFASTINVLVWIDENIYPFYFSEINCLKE